jgi:HK97 family phage prohead protease
LVGPLSHKTTNIAKHMNIRHKQKFEHKKTYNPSNVDQFTIEGYAAIFGICDAHGDIIQHNALLLPHFTLPLLFEHKSNYRIGHITFINKDQQGLYIHAKIDKHLITLQENLLQLVECSFIRGLSIGYKTQDCTYDRTNNNIRHITKAILHEISLVKIPANHRTVITRCHK